MARLMIYTWGSLTQFFLLNILIEAPLCSQLFACRMGTVTYKSCLAQKQQLERLGEISHEHRKQLMLATLLGLIKTYNLLHAQLLRPIIPEEEFLDDKALQKQVGKDGTHLHKHLAKTLGTITPKTIPFNEAVTAIQKLRNLHLQMDNAVLEAYGWQDLNLRHDFYEEEYLPRKQPHSLHHPPRCSPRNPQAAV